MAKLGHPLQSAWPMKAFAPLYYRKGCDIEIKRICEIELQREDVLAELYRHSTRRTYFDLSPACSDIEDASHRKRADKHKMLRQHAPLRTAAGRNRDVLTRVEEFVEIEKLFSNISDKDKLRILREIDPFNPTVTEGDVGDWCTWASILMTRMSTLPTYKQNYVLLTRAGTQYATDVVKEFRHTIPTMSPTMLSRYIGQDVYRILKVNPVTVAVGVVQGRYNCHTHRQVIQRIAQMHLCCSPSIKDAEFMETFFWAVSYKVPEDDIIRFQLACCAEYPWLEELENQVQGTIYETRHGQLDSAMALKRIPPTEPGEVTAFINFLIEKASKDNWSHKEERFQHLRPVTRGLPLRAVPTHSNQRRATSSHEVHAPATSQAASTFDKAKAGVLPKPHPMEQRPAPATPTNATTPRVPCEHCQSTKHKSEACWKAFPQLKEESLRKYGERSSRRPPRDGPDSRQRNPRFRRSQGDAPVTPPTTRPPVQGTCSVDTTESIPRSPRSVPRSTDNKQDFRLRAAQ